LRTSCALMVGDEEAGPMTASAPVLAKEEVACWRAPWRATAEDARESR